MLRRQSRLCSQQGESLGSPPPHWIELAADENTLFAFEPTNRIVPTTRTRITANITAYSAMSWPSSSRHRFQNILNMFHLLPAKCASRTVSNCEEGGGQQNGSIMSEVAGLHLRYAAIVRPGYQLVKQKSCPTRLLAHPNGQSRDLEFHLTWPITWATIGSARMTRKKLCPLVERPEMGKKSC